MTPNINWTALASLLRTLAILAASTFVGALVLPVAADGTLPMTWAAWKPVLAVAGSAAFVAEVVWIRSHLSAVAAAAGVTPAAPSNAVANAAKAILPILILAGLGMTQTGCLADAPTVPVTPANQAQVSACESTATLHNSAVIGDFVFTGGASTLGAVSALESNTGTKNAMAISGAISGGLAIVASSIVALSSSNFTNDQCSGVVGSLPAAVAK